MMKHNKRCIDQLELFFGAIEELVQRPIKIARDFAHLFRPTLADLGTSRQYDRDIYGIATRSTRLANHYTAVRPKYRKTI